MPKFKPEMSLYDHAGGRLYLDATERVAFKDAARQEEPEKRLLCNVLVFTGCRPSEALELTPAGIQLNESAIRFRTLKKRKRDMQGNLKKAQYRAVPVPELLIEELDLVFNLRHNAKLKVPKDDLLWPFTRATAWNTVKRVMARAGIKGPMATSKGLRHAYGMALALDKVPPVAIAKLLGHSDTATTEIYTTPVGGELREFAQGAWL
jgi:integrase